MSVERFLNVMRIQASLTNNARAQTALGTVIAYDSDNFYANIELYPADPSDSESQPLQTGFIPIFSPWVGNGWGFFVAPNIGDVVEVHYQEGSFQNAYCGMRCWTLGNNLSPPSGEMWLVHQSSSYIKMLNTGEIDIVSGSAGSPAVPANINVTSSGIINVTASTINLGGTVNMGDLLSTLTGFLNGSAMNVYNTHTHNDPVSGITGVPNQQMTASELSTHVKGN